LKEEIMKSNLLWKLVTAVFVLIILVPGLMLPTSCGPEKVEATPTPVPVKPTATPSSAAPPTDTPAPLQTGGPVPPPAGLIDDFEGGDFDGRWWPYTDEGTVSFTCTLDQPGHAGKQAMRLTFEVGAGSWPGCGLDVDPSRWGEAGGLSFFWQADQAGLEVIVILSMEDPTQTYPDSKGTTPFEAVLQTPGQEWTPVTLAWDDFAKAEWVGESGASSLDPTRVVELIFQASEAQSGSVWVDDLQLADLEAATAEPTVSPTDTPAPKTIPTQAEPSPPASSSPTGQVYYVAANEPGASDDNNGLYPTHQGGQDGPWLTIQHAANTMTAGETTYVRAGTYYESGISFAHSGAPGAPITLANYQSEEVVIDGSQSTDEIPGIWIVEGRDHYVIQGLAIRNMGWSGIATDKKTTEPFQGITIRDCIMYNNGWSGIDLAAVDGFVVENVEAYDNAYYGLDITGSDDGGLSAANGAVRNSSFYNHTGDEGHGLAINQGHDITVSDSVAYHNTIHGFDVSDWPKYGELTYNITLERNLSYDNGVAGFAINSDSHHVVYRNNVAWRNGADWAGQGSCSGFLCYRGCWHVEWVNNVSLENTDAGFWVEDKVGIYGTPEDTLLVFKNNIAYNNGRPEWNESRSALVVEGEAWEVMTTHNNWGVVPGLNALAVIINLVGDEGDIYTTDDINNGAFQTGNISVDPQFVDATVPDVHLQPGSPCIDAGVDVGLPYLGPAPDMGAFEFER
jgi:hypothetical protein